MDFPNIFFIYRLAIYSLSILTSDMTSYYLYLELFFIAVLVLHVVVQPFEVSSRNTIALLVLLCLLPINTLAVHILSSVSAHGYTSEAIMLQWFQFALVCMPLLTSMIHVLWLLGAYVKRRLCNRQTGYMQLVNTDDNSFLDNLHN